jgi:saccharopine dehydrogenase-like NADP-dependent oxidoreductase
VLKILVLGGYGNFGKRICESLAKQAGTHLVIAGRSFDKAEKLCKLLRPGHGNIELTPIALDILDPMFKEKLKTIQPFLVIHTSGPFQGQDYRVPIACIDSGAHYIDLADDRRFVCDISILDAQAKARNLLVVSGASSVPGLSSTVIDSFAQEFARIDSLDIAIAPGNRAERGEATVKAILSYTGHAISVFENGTWISKFGWMSPRKVNFGGAVGERWLANVDVPDLELFPARYPTVRNVNFQAGLELSCLHWCMVGMAWLTKKGLVQNWAPYVKPIIAASNTVIGLGSDIGGMRIKINGIDRSQTPKELIWHLTAENGIGPYIPTLSTIILAKKLMAGELNAIHGATPCLNLYSLSDFYSIAEKLGVYCQVSINGDCSLIESGGAGG